jgi:voltage-gated potassium channel
MLHFFKHLVVRGTVALTIHGWSIVMLLLILLYASGYFLMLFFEEATVIEHYMWWFAVTITTVGYGDVAPSTIGGQWTAIIIMILGIGSIALLIGKIAEWVIMSGVARNCMVPVILKM